MKYQKITRSVISLSIMMLICLITASCSSNHRTITVYSADYPTLGRIKAYSADVLTEQYIEALDQKSSISDQYYVRLTAEHGDQKARIVVYNSCPDDECYVFDGGGLGWFMGFSNNDNKSGIIYQTRPNACFLENGGQYAIEAEVVLDDRCVALLPSEDSMEYCYAVTGWNGWDEDDVTAVWRLYFPTNDNGNRIVKEKIIDLPETGSVRTATMDENGTIYIMMASSFYAVTPSGHYTKLDMPEHWLSLSMNSMVFLDESLFIGTGYGILEYQTDDGIFYWYPIVE